MGDASSLDPLTSAKTHLQEQGWAVVPDVLSKDEAANVLDRLWQAKSANDSRGEAAYMPRLDPNESNVRVFYLLELDKTFRELITHPTALEMVKAVVGEDFLISNFTANIARPGSGSMALHSDQSIVVPEPWNEAWALNVIWCLTDVYADNGATLFIPGSNSYTSRKEVPDNAAELLKPFEAKAGSIILMDGRVWHTSGKNVTRDVDRALLFGYYTKPFLRQQVNWTAKLGDELKRELLEGDEQGRRLYDWLGLGVSANTARTGDIDGKYLSKVYVNGKREGEKESYY
jgi:fumagillin biosynthesis dioxygenase